MIDPSQFSTTPKPLSDDIRSAIRTITAKTLAIKSAAVVIFVGTIAVYQPALLLVPILAVFLYIWTINNEPLRRERTARQAVLNEAQRVWDYAARIWSEEAGADNFKNKLSEFERLKRDRENLRSEYDREKAKLQLTVRQRQLHKFLNSYFINDHTIPNIGPGRKATLVSFGVETAADIDQRRIQKIRGFGSSLTNELVQWRRKVESKFVFDVSKGIDPADMRALDQKYSQQQAKIENTLLAGPDVLGKLRAEILRKRDSFRNEIVGFGLMTASRERSTSSMSSTARFSSHYWIRANFGTSLSILSFALWCGKTEPMSLQSFCTKRLSISRAFQAKTAEPTQLSPRSAEPHCIAFISVPDGSVNELMKAPPRVRNLPRMKQIGSRSRTRT